MVTVVSAYSLHVHHEAVMRTVCFSLPKPVNIGFGGRTRAKQTCLFLSSVNLIFVCQKDFIHCISNYPNVYMKSTESGRGASIPYFFVARHGLLHSGYDYILHYSQDKQKCCIPFFFATTPSPINTHYLPYI